jgi:hypothetical protein
LEDIRPIDGQLFQLQAGPLKADLEERVSAQCDQVLPHAVDVALDGWFAFGGKALGTVTVLFDDEIHRVLSEREFPFHDGYLPFQ